VHTADLRKGLGQHERTTGSYILTEDQMDAANILSVNDEASNGRPKDDRPLHQQRSVIMNGADCIAQYRSYVNYRDAVPARRALAAEQREESRGDMRKEGRK
jgi:hypothetical protein